MDTYLPPLKGATKYAVVVTNGVKDVLGNPLGRSTAARILLELAANVDASIGVDAGTAALLQQMRSDLSPVWAVLPVPKANVAMAYVFRTQTVTSTSLQLSAAPYSAEATASAAVFSPTAATSVTSSYPGHSSVAAFYDVSIPSLDATSKATGALNPSQAAWGMTVLHALVAVPPASAVTASCPTGGLQCAPLVVFGHGLGGSRSTMLAVADSLAARGFVVAAIDFPQHGDRTWCFKDSDCELGGADGTCTAFTVGGLPAYQGDVDSGTGLAIAPGTCTGGSVPKAAVSGQTFISQNFFRTRDSFRQNLIDQSALVLALARPPSSPQPAANPFTAALAADGIGVAVNPAAVYWEGISLGGIAGTEVLATNPRFSRGVTSVAGGTLVDFFTKAPAFQARVIPLFTGLLKPQLDAIAPGTPFSFALVDPSNGSFNAGVAAAYGKTLLVAKWILDPGEPLNFARHLRTSPLPNLLAGGLQPQKDVLGQVAVGDQVIPNDYERELCRNGAVDVVEYTSLTYTNAQMHGVLGFDPTVQAQSAGYLFDLTKPPAPPTQVTIP